MEFFYLYKGPYKLDIWGDSCKVEFIALFITGRDLEGDGPFCCKHA